MWCFSGSPLVSRLSELSARVHLQDPWFNGSDGSDGENMKQSICSVPVNVYSCCCFFFFSELNYSILCSIVLIISDTWSIRFFLTPRFSSSVYRPSQVCRRQASNTCATARPRFFRRRPIAAYWRLWTTVWVS